MRKVVAISFISAALLVLGAAPAAADPATSTTVIVKDLVETFADTDPCTGAPATVTTTSNGVFHITSKDGTEHTTFTQTGTFTLVPIGAGLTATGHFAIWGGFNVNSGGNVAGTFTFNVSGAHSDGSRFTAHAVDHINTTPTGMENLFSKFHFHC
jgi:hypothetical protein